MCWLEGVEPWKLEDHTISLKDMPSLSMTDDRRREIAEGQWNKRTFWRKCVWRKSSGPFNTSKIFELHSVRNQTTSCFYGNDRLNCQGHLIRDYLLTNCHSCLVFMIYFMHKGLDKHDFWLTLSLIRACKLAHTLSLAAELTHLALLWVRLFLCTCMLFMVYKSI